MRKKKAYAYYYCYCFFLIMMFVADATSIPSASQTIFIFTLFFKMHCCNIFFHVMVFGFWFSENK